MAIALNTLQVVVKMVGELTNVLDLSLPIDSFDQDYTTTFSDGTGANQGNMLWHDQRSVGTGSEDLDLAGGLTSAFGTTITFAVIKGILIYAAAANTGNIIVSRPASNGLVLFAAASDALAALKPGGLFLFTDPSAAGLTVTASTGDLLNIDSSSGTSVYDVWIWGEV
jgi:hypothetical protein